VCTQGTYYDSDPYLCHGTLDQICYRYFQRVLTWQQAEDNCILWGGHLASIKSQAEISLARSFSNVDCWIGFSDQATEGAWVWSDNSTSVYTTWNQPGPGQSEPDNCCGGEDCAYLVGIGTATTIGAVFGSWGDADCSQQQWYGLGLGAAFVKGYLCSKPVKIVPSTGK
jgi:brevican